jgi:hypothetical protein
MIRKKGINSLWEPVESGGKIRAWRNLVTEQLHEGRERPTDMRGAILADDVSVPDLGGYEMFQSSRSEPPLAYRWV